MEAIVFSVPRAAVCMVYWGMEGFLNLASWQVEKRSREPFLYHLVYVQINKGYVMVQKPMEFLVHLKKPSA